MDKKILERIQKEKASTEELDAFDQLIGKAILQSAPPDLAERVLSRIRSYRPWYLRHGFWIAVGALITVALTVMGAMSVPASEVSNLQLPTYEIPQMNWSLITNGFAMVLIMLGLLVVDRLVLVRVMSRS